MTNKKFELIKKVMKVQIALMEICISISILLTKINSNENSLTFTQQ